jgi:acyl transferase domain-containing protein
MPTPIPSPTIPAYSLHTGNDLAELTATLRDGLANPAGSGPFRLALVDPTPERLLVAARIAARGTGHDGSRGIWFNAGQAPAAHGKCAFLFPGVDNRPPPRLDEVAALFSLRWQPPTAIDPRDVLANARQVMASGILLDDAMRQLGVHADGRLGLSCGEWAALAAADGFIDTTALFDCTNVGLQFPDLAYLATGIGASALARHIEAIGAGADMAISHDNSPGQAIACGVPGSIGRLRAALVAQGVFAVELPFRSGFHVPAFAPHVERMLAFLGLEARAPAHETWSGVTAAPLPADDAACRALLRRHFVEPVAFARSIRAMHDDGYRCFIDLGTGSLTQLVSATLADAPHVVVPVAHHARPGDDGLQRALLALWVAHRPVDPHALATRAAPRHAA